MKRYVWVLRHGEAEAWRADSEDSERSLTPTGKVKIQELGHRLKDHKATLPTRVLCSAATRTQETFELLRDALTTGDLQVEINPAIYTADEAALAALIMGQDEAVQSILLVGHNPAVSEFASSLAKTPLAFSPGECIKLEADCKTWSELCMEAWKCSPI